MRPFLGCKWDANGMHMRSTWHGAKRVFIEKQPLALMQQAPAAHNFFTPHLKKQKAAEAACLN
jgi:hypothetical protein